MDIENSSIWLYQSDIISLNMQIWVRDSLPNNNNSLTCIDLLLVKRRWPVSPEPQDGSYVRKSLYITMGSPSFGA